MLGGAWDFSSHRGAVRCGYRLDRIRLTRLASRSWRRSNILEFSAFTHWMYCLLRSASSQWSSRVVSSTPIHRRDAVRLAGRWSRRIGTGAECVCDANGILTGHSVGDGRDQGPIGSRRHSGGPVQSYEAIGQSGSGPRPGPCWLPWRNRSPVPAAVARSG